MMTLCLSRWELTAIIAFLAMLINTVGVLSWLFGRRAGVRSLNARLERAGSVVRL